MSVGEIEQNVTAGRNVTRSASRNGRTMGVSIYIYIYMLKASVVMTSKVIYIYVLLKIMTVFLELLGPSIFS